MRSIPIGHLMPIVIGHYWAFDAHRRYLLEVLIEHVADDSPLSGKRMRFYKTHLYNATRDHHSNWQYDRKRFEALSAIDIIKDNAESGELPPIFVGDFNWHPDFTKAQGIDIRNAVRPAFDVVTSSHTLTDVGIRPPIPTERLSNKR